MNCQPWMVTNKKRKQRYSEKIYRRHKQTNLFGREIYIDEEYSRAEMLNQKNNNKITQYLITSADIFLIAINMDTVGNIRRLLFNGNE